MRRWWPCLIATVLLALPGCDEDGSSAAKGKNTPLQAAKKEGLPPQDAPVPSPQPLSDEAGRAAAPLDVPPLENAAAPATFSAGRALFDGEKNAAGPGAPGLGSTAPAPVVMPAGPKARPVAYSGAARSLSPERVPPPPAPEGGSDRRAKPAAPLATTSALGPAGAGRPDGVDAAALNAAGPVPAGAACPAGMAAIGAFCMDQYEAPNRVDAAPLFAQTAQEADRQCSSWGKRLCTEDEWTRACQGPEGRPFPYGTEYEHGRCNDDGEDRLGPSPSIDWNTLNGGDHDKAMAYAASLNKALPSGTKKGCATPEGVYDLIGNVTEWTTRSNARWPYPYVMKGGFWYGAYKTRAPTCGFVNPAHSANFRSYEAGFRCCLTPA